MEDAHSVGKNKSINNTIFQYILIDSKTKAVV